MRDGDQAPQEVTKAAVGESGKPGRPKALTLQTTPRDGCHSTEQSTAVHGELDAIGTNNKAVED